MPIRTNKFQKCEDRWCQNAIICKGLLLNTIKRHLDGRMDGRHILSYLPNLFCYLHYCVDLLSVWIWCLNACHKNARRACCQCRSISGCFSQMFWGQEIVEVLKLESCLVIPWLYFIFHNVLNRGQARNTGRSAWYVRSFTLKSICCRQQNVSLFSSRNKQKCLNGSICCTATCMFPLSVNGAITDMHVTHDTGPRCHHRLLHDTRDETKLILFLLYLEGSDVPRAAESWTCIYRCCEKLLLTLVRRILPVFYYAAQPRGAKVTSIQFQFVVFALHMQEFPTVLWIFWMHDELERLKSNTFSIQQRCTFSKCHSICWDGL